MVKKNQDFLPIINDYLIELNELVKILYTYTSLIINNLWIDMIAYNPQFKKYKTTKISIITEIQKKI